MWAAEARSASPATSQRTLEPLEECNQRPATRFNKKGKPVTQPRRAIKWEWGGKHQRAFGEPKTAIVENAIFGGSEGLQYHLSADASKNGMGGMLSQLVDSEPGALATSPNREKMRAIIISKRFADAEARYTITTEQGATGSGSLLGRGRIASARIPVPYESLCGSFGAYRSPEARRRTLPDWKAARQASGIRCGICTSSRTTECSFRRDE